MKNNIATDESPISIIISILLLYGLIEGFFFYLYALKRISIVIFLICSVVFFIIYIPRFLIINKLRYKDDIKVTDYSIVINNNREIFFDKISDYRVDEGKSQVLFFFNYKMVVYKTATFHLKVRDRVESFDVFGTQKIELIKEFLDDLLERE